MKEFLQFKFIVCFPTATSVFRLSRNLSEGEFLGELSRNEIMVDGADWVGMSQQLPPCLGILGYSINELPIRFFSPLIEDWAGSKFSKPAYVKSGAYEGIHPALCDYEEFKKSFDEGGLDLVWNETLEWVLDSKKFFRNYPVDYFTQGRKPFSKTLTKGKY